MGCFVNPRQFFKLFFLKLVFISFFLFFAAFVKPSFATLQIGSRLLYDRQNSGEVPIPPSERNLLTVVAADYYRVTKENHLLAGSVFDDKGNLFFCDWTAKKILRLNAGRLLSRRNISLVTELKEYHPSGLAFGPDGRLYIAAYAEEKDEGAIYAIMPDGGTLETIIAPEKGFVPKNLLFNRARGLYFTDFKGTPSRLEGGVYYVSPDLKNIHLMVDHLALPNGIMLSPDQKTLWLTETGRNNLHQIELETPTQPKSRGWRIPYHFTGPAPESISGGSDGNVYVPLKGQGRVLILNANGLPIGQILIPGRSKGHNLLSSNIAIQPDSKNLYILSSDSDKGWGAHIFKQTSFGHGLNFQDFDPDTPDV
ncbi:SMP-30/gluconolactonase/LRE family protein [Acetobacteraceae bacterium]|nr:SMP-30/gluconolactonase/LRE family protein [Acetobacteraceae bacterium]